MACEKWQASIPTMDKTMGLIMFIINIFWPGFGTLFAACIGKTDNSTDQFIVGILQIFTSMCLVGWIWAIWWGYLIYQKAQ